MVKRSQYVASMVPGFRGLDAKGVGMGSTAVWTDPFVAGHIFTYISRISLLRCAGLEPLKILKVTAHWSLRRTVVEVFMHSSKHLGPPIFGEVDDLPQCDGFAESFSCSSFIAFSGVAITHSPSCCYYSSTCQRLRSGSCTR